MNRPSYCAFVVGLPPDIYSYQNKLAKTSTNSCCSNILTAVQWNGEYDQIEQWKKHQALKNQTMAHAWSHSKRSHHNHIDSWTVNGTVFQSQWLLFVFKWYISTYYMETVRAPPLFLNTSFYFRLQYAAQLYPVLIWSIRTTILPSLGILMIHKHNPRVEWVLAH